MDFPPYAQIYLRLEFDAHAVNAHSAQGIVRPSTGFSGPHSIDYPKDSKLRQRDVPMMVVHVPNELYFLHVAA